MEAKLLMSSKDSFSLIKKKILEKNLNNFGSLKSSNEICKIPIINRIYNKLAFFQDNNHKQISINKSIKKRNPVNERILKTNLSKNFQNNKGIIRKRNVQFPSKKGVKEKLYGYFTSKNLSKNNLKQTKKTSEVNKSLNENNNAIKKALEKRKDKNKIINENNQIIDTIANINHKKKKKIIKFNDIKKSNQNSNIIIGKKKETHSFKILNYQEIKNKKKYWEKSNNETQIQKNKLSHLSRENKINNYFSLVSAHIFNNRNNKEKQKFRNLSHNVVINNNRSYHVEKLLKYKYKKDLDTIPNIMWENTLKSNGTYNKILLIKNNETIDYDQEKISSEYINKTADELSISGKNNNKYKKFIINKIMFNKPNKTISKKIKILKIDKGNIKKFNEIENNQPYLHYLLKHYEYRNTEKRMQTKKVPRIKISTVREIRSKNLYSAKICLNKEIKKCDVDIKNSHLYFQNSLNNTTDEKLRKNINNSIIWNGVKKINKTENKTKILNQNKENKYEEKNNLNQKFFEKFKGNNDEDNKTNREEVGTQNILHINNIKYFNDAKKTLKKYNLLYKKKTSKSFLDIIFPNKSTVIGNESYNKIEDEELSNRTIKVPIFVDINLLNNLVESTNDKNTNYEIKNLYDIISKLNNYIPKKLFLNFLDDKSLMILSSTNRQFYINLRIMFYNNIYTKIFNDKKHNFINKIKISTFSYSSNEIKNCEQIKLKEKYESYGNKKSQYNDLIKIDIYRTFPCGSDLTKNNEKLYNFLTRYSNYNTSIGYVQGLNFIAANALSFFEKEEEAFLFIDGLINLLKLENYFGKNNSSLTLEIKKFSNIISKYVPDVIKNFEKKSISHECFSLRWILTLFSNSMNSKNLMITWCFMIVFGWKFFYCFVIQILSFYKNDIYKTCENSLGKKMTKLLEEERFNNDIKKIISNTLAFMSQNIIM